MTRNGVFSDPLFLSPLLSLGLRRIFGNLGGAHNSRFVEALFIRRALGATGVLLYFTEGHRKYSRRLTGRACGWPLTINMFVFVISGKKGNEKLRRSNIALVAVGGLSRVISYAHNFLLVPLIPVKQPQRWRNTEGARVVVSGLIHRCSLHFYLLSICWLYSAVNCALLSFALPLLCLCRNCDFGNW